MNLKSIADNGQIIETGWLALREVSLKDAPAFQVSEMRKAFFSGAQHLFACIINTLDEGSEPTEADMRRIELIHAELELWVASMKADKELK